MTPRRPTPVFLATSTATVLALGFAGLGLLRYATFTNRTFDLAFYARMAWGLVRFDFWDPILGTHVFGLHLSPVLVPIGLVGLAIGTPAALLLAQGLAVGLATLPLARIAERHLGPKAGFAALALVLHPNVGHVLSFEAHPGTLAVLPLAWLADALDRRDARTLAFASLGVLACREDLALVVVLAALVLAWTSPASRRASLTIALLAFGYLAFFALVLHPAFRPPEGSMELHFGRWGHSLGEVLVAWLTHPREVLAHLSTPARLSYLPRVMAPLLLLPILAPRFLVVASPVLGIALLSVFPTTTKLESHYLTPALPFLVAGALVGAGAVVRRLASMRSSTPAEGRAASVAPSTSRLASLDTASCLAYALVVASLVGSLVAGVLSPLRAAPAFTHPDLDPAIARRLLAHVPRTASIQAPDRFLPHVAERRLFFRAAPPDRGADYLLVDLTHRARYAHAEDLLRTTEEPFTRSTFARDDLALVDHGGGYALFRKGTASHEARIAAIRAPTEVLRALAASTHDALAASNHDAPAASNDRVPREARLTACLSILDARFAPPELVLVLRADAPCANDLALRLGVEECPARVDLLFDGLVSPSALRAGDVVVSHHAWTGPVPRTLFVGALRSSGARPDPSDPIAVRVTPSALDLHDPR